MRNSPLATLLLVACGGHAATPTPPSAPPRPEPASTSSGSPARSMPSAIREERPWSEVPCAGASHDCRRDVGIDVGDFVSFDNPEDASAQLALSAQLRARAPELAGCYLTTYGARDTAAYFVIPFVIAASGSLVDPDEIALEATPASDLESQVLACVRDRMAGWELPVDPAPAKVMFSIMLGPQRA
jgi:hypothetical protein